MNNKWRVQRARRRDGSLYQHMIAWDVHDAEGTWRGLFETWDEAMEWATSIAAHVEWWLECETRQR